MHPHTLSGALFLAVTVGLADRASEAAWPHEVTGANVPVCTASGAQTAEPAVSDGAGGMLIAWTDARGGSSNNAIYMQRVRADGVPLWAENGIAVCPGGVNQRLLKDGLLSDGAGGVIVLWRDGPIRAQRVDTLGNSLWAPDGVVVSPSSASVQAPVGCTDGAGGAIVSWISQTPTAATHILAQRLLADGTTAWGVGPVPVCVVGDPTSVVVAPDATHGAYFAFRRSGGSPQGDVFMQRLNGAGTPQWTVNGELFIANTAFLPFVASDGLGGALLVGRPNGGGALAAQRIDAAGTKLWGGDGDTLSAINYPVDVSIVPDGSGGGFFAWREIAVEPYRIRAQRLSAAGEKLWTDSAVVVCDAAYRRNPPFMGLDGSGGVFLSWGDRRIDIASDLYVQRLDASGLPQWTPQGVVVSANPWSQGLTSSFVLDHRGGIILAWRDTRTNNIEDIYAQRVDGYGYLGDAEPVITSVLDVPDDHGGVVDVAWDASYLDPPGGTIVDYEVSRLDADWVPVGILAASAASSYSLTVPTTADSSAVTSGLTSFRVKARTAGAPAWNSASADGYSVDNLGSVGVPPAPRAGLALEAPSPNPARGTATIRWSLARRGPARLVVFDLGGRVVRVLHHGDAPAGAHVSTFEAGGRHGELPPGLYVVRLSAEGLTLARRLALIR